MTRKLCHLSGTGLVALGGGHTAFVVRIGGNGETMLRNG
jgi:hypothetical protein